MPTAQVAANDSTDELVGSGFVKIEIGTALAEALADVVSAGNSFFGLPLTEKIKWRSASDAGYRPYGVEYSGTPEVPDDMETFSVTASLPTTDLPAPSPAGRFLYDKGQVAFDLLEAVTGELTDLISRRLGVDASENLRGGFHEWSTLQVNHSHPASCRTEFINELHEDGHFLTLAYATSAGLEVRRANGSFAKLTTSPTEIVVMLGGVASLMTDARLPAAYHRVRAYPECPDRTSIMFFADFEPESCHPWIVGDGNRNIDIGRKIRDNPARFGLTGNSE
jgi:isopenicillin N synthase-like dioxygenase